MRAGHVKEGVGVAMQTDEASLAVMRKSLADAIERGTPTVLEIDMTAGFIPWKRYCLGVLSRECSGVRAVIFSRSRGWRVQAVPVRHGSSDCRALFPLSWRGLHDEELCEEAGIAGSLFVHSNGHLAAHDSLEGAWEMAGHVSPQEGKTAGSPGGDDRTGSLDDRVAALAAGALATDDPATMRRAALRWHALGRSVLREQGERIDLALRCFVEGCHLLARFPSGGRGSGRDGGDVEDECGAAGASTIQPGCGGCDGGPSEGKDAGGDDDHHHQHMTQRQRQHDAHHQHMTQRQRQHDALVDACESAQAEVLELTCRHMDALGIVWVRCVGEDPALAAAATIPGHGGKHGKQQFSSSRTVGMGCVSEAGQGSSGSSAAPPAPTPTPRLSMMSPRMGAGAIEGDASSALLCQRFPLCALVSLKLLFSAPAPVDGAHARVGHAKQLAEAINCLPARTKRSLRGKDKSLWAFFVFIRNLLVADRGGRGSGRGGGGGGQRATCPTEETGDSEGGAGVEAVAGPRDSLRLFGHAPPAMSTATSTTTPGCPLGAVCDEPLYILGDSHVLTFAWRTVVVGGRRRIIVPWLLTGIKAWHCRPGSTFFTAENMRRALASLPQDTREILFSAGEIDCREGLRGAVAKGRYASLQEAAAVTALAYLDGLQQAAQRYSWDIAVIPVPPPALRGKRVGREDHRALRELTVRLFNAQLRAALPRGAAVAAVASVDPSLSASLDPQKRGSREELCSPPGSEKEARLSRFSVRLCDFAEDLYSKGAETLHPQFDCDHTHINANVVPLLRRQLALLFPATK